MCVCFAISYAAAWTVRSTTTDKKKTTVPEFINFVFFHFLIFIRGIIIGGSNEENNQNHNGIIYLLTIPNQFFFKFMKCDKIKLM